MKTFGIEAHIELTPWANQDTLHLIRRDGNVIHTVLSDGDWAAVPEGVDLPPNAGIPLPRGAWEAIKVLAAPHADAGEVRALKEALEIERQRVDRVISGPGWIVSQADQ